MCVVTNCQAPADASGAYPAGMCLRHGMEWLRLYRTAEEKKKVHPSKPAIRLFIFLLSLSASIVALMGLTILLAFQRAEDARRIEKLENTVNLLTQQGSRGRTFP